MQHFVTLIQFAFATRNRAIVSGIVLAVFAGVVMFRPQIIARAVSNLLGAILAGVLSIIGPHLGGIFLTVFVFWLIFQMAKSAFGKKK
jgi:hypothetical protein